MRRWQLLVGAASLAQLAWGGSAFVEYARSVGGGREPTAGWVYAGLGLSGLLALAWPRSGYLTAAVQLAAAAYALRVYVVALALSRVWVVLPVVPPPVTSLLMTISTVTAVLCGVNAVGTFQIARGRRSVESGAGNGPEPPV